MRSRVVGTVEPDAKPTARAGTSWTVVLPAVLVAGLAMSGCAVHRYSRTLLPAGVEGPRPAISEEHRIEIDAQRVELTREYFRIHNPELARRLPEGDAAEAISFRPRMVVVHFTAIPTLEETLELFRPALIADDREIVRRNGQLNVGIQFVVDRDGTIYRLYPETVIARHVIGLNHVAIGIENVGTGDLGERGAEAPLTEAQLEANVALIRYLAGRHPSIDYVIGHAEYRDVERPAHPAHQLFHEEIAAYRTEKVDPGRRFMKRLRRELRPR